MKPRLFFNIVAVMLRMIVLEHVARLPIASIETRQKTQTRLHMAIMHVLGSEELKTEITRIINTNPSLVYSQAGDKLVESIISRLDNFYTQYMIEGFQSLH